MQNFICGSAEYAVAFYQRNKFDIRQGRSWAAGFLPVQAWAMGFHSRALLLLVVAAVCFDAAHSQSSWYLQINALTLVQLFTPTAAAALLWNIVNIFYFVSFRYKKWDLTTKHPAFVWQKKLEGGNWVGQSSDDRDRSKISKAFCCLIGQIILWPYQQFL